MTTEPTDAELKALWQIHAADIGGRKGYPLADFQEGQWWVDALDAMVSHPIGQAIRVTPDMRRAVAVVHNLLRAATAPQPSPTAQAAESVTAPAQPPECETEAEKRAFAFGWFKALESERMKAESAQEDAAQKEGE